MKVKIPDLLEMAIKNNDMELVSKAYTAITGKTIEIVNQEPKSTNGFVDDGSLVPREQIDQNPELQKLYDINQTARRNQPSQVEVACSCGNSEWISQDRAKYHKSPGNPPFRCNRCLMSTR